MENKKLLLLLIISLNSVSVIAQTEIGASYELRDVDPKSGFGVRVQKDFLKPLPLMSIGLRAHASFFNDEKEISERGFIYSQDLANYDLGIAIIGGVSVGLIEPYVGLGLGSTTLDLGKKEYEGVIFDGIGLENEKETESNIYWSAHVGAKVSILPILKPFVEYRYSNTSLSEPEEVEFITGRIIFGVTLSF